MALTKAELRVRTKQLLGNRTSTTGAVIDDTWYDERVMDGYRQLCTFQGPVQLSGRQRPVMRTLRFFELEDRTARSLTTVLSSNFVAPAASNVYVVTDVYDRTNNRGLDMMSERERRHCDPDLTGMPRRWRPGGQGGAQGYYLDKYPGSSADEIDVYEMSYLYPTALSGDADEPVIPDVWHPAIYILAAAAGADLMDMADRAQELRGDFYRFIAERKSPYEEMHRAGMAGTRRSIRVGTWK